jgi:hypothetical protein
VTPFPPATAVARRSTEASERAIIVTVRAMAVQEHDRECEVVWSRGVTVCKNLRTYFAISKFRCM